MQERAALMDTIPALPEIPEALKTASATGGLVLFIGAGVSRLAKCPGWEEFAEALLMQLVDRKAINYSQAKQINDQKLPPRLKLTFITNIAHSKNVKLNYEEAVHNKGDLTNVTGRQVYRALGKLSKYIVTTNYDYWLDTELAAEKVELNQNEKEAATTEDAARANIFYKKTDITFDKLLLPNTVVHLHGSLKSPDTMIVTTNEYLNYYSNTRSPKTGAEENPIISFLQTLFREKVLLFVGYGMADLELLEYIILKSDADTKKPKHFILQSFYSHELEIAKLYERYYADDCGMTMMPFLLDDRFHNQLVEVVEHLAKSIQGGELLPTERQLLMAGMLA